MNFVPKNWTLDQMERLPKLFADGLSTAEIGLRLNKTYFAVKFQLSKMGLRQIEAAWSPEALEILRRGHERGDSFSTIANAIRGKTRNACIGKAQRLGLPKRGQHENPLARKPRPSRAHRFQQVPQRKTRLFLPSPSRLPTQPLPPPPSNAPPSLNLSILELQIGACKWPVNDGGPYLFCGNAALPTQSYCGFHFRLAHRP